MFDFFNATAANAALQDAGKSAVTAYASASASVASALDESGAALQDAGKKAGAALSDATSDESLEALDGAFGSALDSVGKAFGSASASATDYLDSSGATEALQSAGKSAGAALSDGQASVLSALQESGAEQQIAEAEASLKAALNTSGVGAAYNTALNNVLAAFTDAAALTPGTCSGAHRYSLICHSRSHGAAVAPRLPIQLPAAILRVLRARRRRAQGRGIGAQGLQWLGAVHRGRSRQRAAGDRAGRPQDPPRRREARVQRGQGGRRLDHDALKREAPRPYGARACCLRPPGPPVCITM